MKQTLFILTFLFASTVTIGQNCNCLKNFDFLKTKIENDYAGFNDKVNSSTKTEYNQFSSFYRKKAEVTTTTQRCMLLMEDWLSTFKTNTYLFQQS